MAERGSNVGRTPRRCRWFGHAWVSTISGEPVDWVIGHSCGFVGCRRCGRLFDEPIISPQVAKVLRELEISSDA